MHTINDWDTTEAKEYEPFENPPSGGYVWEVVGVNDKPSTTGKAMVTLSMDIAEGPHAKAFAKFPKPYRQLIDGTNLPYFKAMIKHFTESNPGKMERVIFRQRDNTMGFNPQGLLGLRIGGNLREAEYVKQGTQEVKIGLEVAWLGSVKDVPLMKPQPIKRLQGQSKPTTRLAGSAPSAQDDDSGLPF